MLPNWRPLELMAPANRAQEMRVGSREGQGKVGSVAGETGINARLDGELHVVAAFGGGCIEISTTLPCALGHAKAPYVLYNPHPVTHRNACVP